VFHRLDSETLLDPTDSQLTLLPTLHARRVIDPAVFNLAPALCVCAAGRSLLISRLLHQDLDEYYEQCSKPPFQSEIVHPRSMPGQTTSQRGAHRPREDRDRAPLGRWGDARERPCRPSQPLMCSHANNRSLRRHPSCFMRGDRLGWLSRVESVVKAEARLLAC
jgi:hypothetical protein